METEKGETVTAKGKLPEQKNESQICKLIDAKTNITDDVYTYMFPLEVLSISASPSLRLDAQWRRPGRAGPMARTNCGWVEEGPLWSHYSVIKFSGGGN